MALDFHVWPELLGASLPAGLAGTWDLGPGTWGLGPGAWGWARTIKLWASFGGQLWGPAYRPSFGQLTGQLTGQLIGQLTGQLIGLASGPGSWIARFWAMLGRGKSAGCLRAAVGA